MIFKKQRERKHTSGGAHATRDSIVVAFVGKCRNTRVTNIRIHIKRTRGAIGRGRGRFRARTPSIGPCAVGTMRRHRTRGLICTKITSVSVVCATGWLLTVSRSLFILRQGTGKWFSGVITFTKTKQSSTKTGKTGACIATTSTTPIIQTRRTWCSSKTVVWIQSVTYNKRCKETWCEKYKYL